MKESVLNNKWVLGVNSNEDVLNVLQEKILKAAPKCHFEKATAYREAFEYLVFFMYDLVHWFINTLTYFSLCRRKFYAKRC